MIPVSLRDRLHELTGSELTVWLAVVLHSDANSESFPSNELLMEETGLSHNTLADAKKGLRSKGWFTSAQRYRENGSLSSMGEKWYIPKHRGDISPEVGGIPPQEQGIGYPANLGVPEVDTLEVDTEKPDTSKPQDQNLVSKKVSEASLAPLATYQRLEEQQPVQGSLPRTKPDDSLWDRDQEREYLAQESIPYWSDVLDRGLDIKEVVIAEELYLDLIPLGKMDEADIVTLYELATACTDHNLLGQVRIRRIWHWNKLHKKGNLQFRTIQGLAKALRSESDNNVWNQYSDHNPTDCPKCKKLKKCLHCHQLEDCTNGDAYLTKEHRGQYLHKACGDYWSRQCYQPYSKAASAGTGFEHEDAE